MFTKSLIVAAGIATVQAAKLMTQQNSDHSGQAHAQATEHSGNSIKSLLKMHAQSAQPLESHNSTNDYSNYYGGDQGYNYDNYDYNQADNYTYGDYGYDQGYNYYDSYNYDNYNYAKPSATELVQEQAALVS